MQSFDSDGLKIAFLDEGAGDPVVLVHGFASSVAMNWVGPGWVATLIAGGRRVVALDHRGHGRSDRPHDPAAYSADAMSGDVLRLMDHLGIGRADLIGYSMGARLSGYLALRAPTRARSLVLGGVGDALFRARWAASEEIATALEAPNLDAVATETGRTFRRFAEKTQSDLVALAACARGLELRIRPEDIAGLAAPVLLAVGTRDDIAGPADALRDLVPDIEVLPIPNRDHMTAVGDKVFKAGVLDFLARRP